MGVAVVTSQVSGSSSCGMETAWEVGGDGRTLDIEGGRPRRPCSCGVCPWALLSVPLPPAVLGRLSLCDPVWSVLTCVLSWRTFWVSSSCVPPGFLTTRTGFSLDSVLLPPA